METEKTNRNFDIIKFQDRNNVDCSLQKSSLAYEDCIWFGCNNPDPKQLIPGIGWQEIKLPPDTNCNTRMHLSRKQVKELLPYLLNFIETGELNK